MDGLIAKLTEYKLAEGKLPPRICVRCGNTEDFRGYYPEYEPLRIKIRHGEEVYVTQRQARYLLEVKDCSTFTEAELREFVDEHYCAVDADPVGVFCAKCGCEPKVLSEQQLKKYLQRHRHRAQ